MRPVVPDVAGPGPTSVWDYPRPAMAEPSYPAPTPVFASLSDHIAFSAAPFDGCFVDSEPVVPQPGGFYGGWITADLAGPFKGVPSSPFW